MKRFSDEIMALGFRERTESEAAETGKKAYAAFSFISKGGLESETVFLSQEQRGNYDLMAVLKSLEWGDYAEMSGTLGNNGHITEITSIEKVEFDSDGLEGFN